MSSRLLLFGGAVAGTILGLSLVLSPRVFRTVVRGVAVGMIGGGTITYVNYLRHHSIKSTVHPLGLTPPPLNFAEMQPLLYDHMSEEYKNRGELELGEESITVQPNVFAQIGVLDVNGVRQMWTKAILPSLSNTMDDKFIEGYASAADDLESRVVFCDIGCGVGNVCLQLLAETGCQKSVGVEIIPSRVHVAEVATENAQKYYKNTFHNKQAIWLQQDLVTCGERLREEGVNVLFSHSWMFDDDLMRKLTEVIAEVPSMQCVITSRKLHEETLSQTQLKLHALTYFYADWNEQAPFYIYRIQSQKSV